MAETKLTKFNLTAAAPDMYRIICRVVVGRVMTDDDNGPWFVAIDGVPFKIDVEDGSELTRFELDRRAAIAKAKGET